MLYYTVGTIKKSNRKTKNTTLSEQLNKTEEQGKRYNKTEEQ
jgi:hypothetical protein